jgi:hypothetical protein
MLRHEWNGQPPTWNWDSDIYLDDLQWNFVALVAEPTRSTLYRVDENGAIESAINTFPNEIEEFDGWTLIAGNQSDSYRFFRGYVSDVRIYDYSLSENEIRGLAEVNEIVYIPMESLADLVVGNKDPNYPDVDDQIDFADFSVLAGNWLTEVLWP